MENSATVTLSVAKPAPTTITPPMGNHTMPSRAAGSGRASSAQ